jgi:hypothetical protein
LFFTSPVLLLGLIAVFVMGHNRERRPEALLFGSVFFAYLLMNSAFNNWHAGWTFGPRYLIPAIPFIALPLARVFARIPRLAVGFALLSIFLMFLFTAVDPQVTESVANPLFDHILRIVRGDNVLLKASLLTRHYQLIRSVFLRARVVRQPVSAPSSVAGTRSTLGSLSGKEVSGV